MRGASGDTPKPPQGISPAPPDAALGAPSTRAAQPEFPCAPGGGLHDATSRRVLLAELRPAATALARLLGVFLRHHVVGRPHRAGLAVARGVEANLLQLDVVRREDLGRLDDVVDRLAGPGAVVRNLLGA